MTEVWELRLQVDDKACMNSMYGSTEKKFNEQCWDKPSIRYKSLDSLPHSLYTKKILDTLNSVKYLMTSFFIF